MQSIMRKSTEIRKAVRSMVTLLPAVVFLTGCDPKVYPEPHTRKANQPNYSKPIQEVYMYHLHGKYTIQDREPTHLIIDGMSNVFTIEKGANVTQITVRGSDQSIMLPRGTKTKINDKGSGTTITYY